MDFRPYDVWQEVLSGAFFGPDQADRPVIFYIDDEEAARLKEAHSIATSLPDAVRLILDLGAGRPYAAVEHHHAYRRSDTEPPHYLPVLACSVMAASRMVTDGEYRKSNFHDRFSQLLAHEDGVLTSANFEAVRDMWLELGAWQTRQGTSRGIRTIPLEAEAPQSQARIWYALSQAIMRGSDRDLAYTIFARLHSYGRGAWPPSSDKLLESVMLPRYRDSFSDAFRHAAADPDLRPVLENHLARLAADWDGLGPRSRTGSPRGELHIRFEARRLTWVAKMPHGSAAHYALPDGISLNQIADTRYYECSALVNPSPETLEHGVWRQGRDLTLFYRAAPVIVLREDPELGCYLSTDHLVPFDQHVILAAPGSETVVGSLLKTAASPGTEASRKVAWVPDGWTAYSKVVFADAAKLTAAMAAQAKDEGGELEPFKFARQDKIGLSGGLPLMAELDKNVYLYGGEPDLVLPYGYAGDVRLNGELQVPPFAANGLPIPLAPLRLAPDDYEVSLDTSSAKFAIRENRPGSAEWSTPDSGRCGFALGPSGMSASGQVIPAGGTALYGADCSAIAPRSLPNMVLIRRGAEKTILITSKGRVAILPEPAIPPWWERFDVPPSKCYFEVDLKGEAGWILQSRSDRWSVYPGFPEPPQVEVSVLDAEWAPLVLAAAGSFDDVVWRQYVETAQRMSE